MMAETLWPKVVPLSLLILFVSQYHTFNVSGLVMAGVPSALVALLTGAAAFSQNGGAGE